MRRLFTATLVMLGLVAALPAGQGLIFTPNGIIPVLDSYLEPLRTQAGIPGMSAAVIKDGAILWEKGYGFQNVNARIRATPDTPYLVGDLSGTLAAVLLLQCVEQRHLELDRPLASYGIEGAGPGSTLRQVLSHTSSDPNAEAFAYNPDRYRQLTQVMEHCAPQPYRKSVAHRILNHLAMRDSVPGTDFREPSLALSLTGSMFDPADVERYQAVLERMAVPYKVDGRGKADRSDFPLEGINATAGLVSTVRDLAKLDGALDDRILLLDDTLAQAWNPATTGRGTPAPFGLGWFVQSYRGQRIVWHFGQVTNAYSSLIVKLPDHKLTFVLLANSDRLNSPFQLQSGDISKSLFATTFLKLVT
jgi:CubicO group peptidase (beta-lactamase class C family)